MCPHTRVTRSSRDPHHPYARQQIAIGHTSLVYEAHQILFSSVPYGKAMRGLNLESLNGCVYCNVVSIDIQCTRYTQMHKEH